MNLLSELYTRVNQTSEKWGNIQSVHITQVYPDLLTRLADEP